MQWQNQAMVGDTVFARSNHFKSLREGAEIFAPLNGNGNFAPLPHHMRYGSVCSGMEAATVA
jgi:hypothetical protein